MTAYADGGAQALAAFGLSKRYRDRRAVERVDIAVRPGEVHGLLGLNGAGKTTLLRACLGLVRPDAGTVRLLGERVAADGGALHPRVAGFADTPRFYPYLSGRANLELLARLDGDTAGGVDDALARVGLAPHAHVKVSGYSTGMRQRLGLAAALLRAPALLLMDEPSSALDTAGAAALRDEIRRLAARGTAVLLSSHDMAEIEALCASVTILREGRVAFSGTLEALRARLPSGVHRLRTSDDAVARTVASDHAGVRVALLEGGAGLEVSAGQADLDAYVLAVHARGVAVRGLELRESSLESIFLDLARAGDVVPEASPPPAQAVGAPLRRALRVGSLVAVVGVEIAKLAAQGKTWGVLALCVVSPFAFVLAVHAQGTLPEDTLFGRWVKASGFAVPLVVLGFAAAWAFPVLTSVVGGDIFASEDRYGTWPTILTRGRTRSEVFVGKALTAIVFSLLTVALLGASSIAAGVLFVGRQPLVGLSGTLLAPERTLPLVACAWLSVIPPVLGFTSLALLASVASRSSVAGVSVPVLVGLTMELGSALNGPDGVRRALLTPPFVGWHGLFADRPYYGPLTQGAVTSVVYLAVCLGLAYARLRRRDIGA